MINWLIAISLAFNVGTLVEVDDEPEIDSIELEEIFNLEEVVFDNPELDMSVIEDKEVEEDKLEPEIDTNFEALVMATWRLETGNGTSRLWLTYNNPGGVKCGSEYCRYSSKEQGLQSLRTLLTKYVDRFGYDFEAIRSVYSESDDTQLFRQIFYEEKEKYNE